MMRLFLCIFLLCEVLHVSAQQVLNSKEMIGITPAIPAEMDAPEHAKKILEQKLRQIATQNGFGSFSGDFVLTANVLVTDKQVTATTPAQFVLELEISLYVVNIQEGVIVDETAVVYKGVDKVENRAFIQAVNNLNPRSPAIRNFMKECRGKIVDYYTTRVPVLLAKAKSLTERSQYGEALAVLSVIPESVDEYPAIADQMVAIYVKELDKQAATVLQEVKVKMAKKEYGDALELLLKIDPASGRFAEASRMIDSIKQTIDAKERAELEARLKEMEERKEARLREQEEKKEARQRAHDDEVMLEKLRIDAARQMGAAYAQESGQASVDKKLSDWFLGKFK